MKMRGDIIQMLPRFCIILLTLSDYCPVSNGLLRCQ